MYNLFCRYHTCRKFKSVLFILNRINQSVFVYICEILETVLYLRARSRLRAGKPRDR